MTSPPTLSVVLSFRNEEANLPELIRRLRAVLGAQRDEGHLKSWELVFVNDDSNDRSEQIIQAAAAGHEDIRMVTTSRPWGVSLCALLGMEHASGDLVIYMDADLQDPPEVIPQLLSLRRESPDVEVVHTVRLSRAGESRIKMGLTRLGYWVLNRLATIQLPANAGDFKLLSRRVVNHLVQFREKRPYLRGLVCWVGFKQASVGYHRDARWRGKTKFPILSQSVLFNFLDSALISFSDVPLKISSLVGFFISGCALLGALAAVVGRMLGYVIEPWMMVMIVVLFLGGIQLIFIGILGLYVSAIHVESRRRPNTIIDRTYGLPNPSETPSPPAEKMPHD